SSACALNRAPFAAISRPVSCSCASRTSQPMTCAPSAASSTAMARPSPCAAPVTRATLPSNRMCTSATSQAVSNVTDAGGGEHSARGRQHAGASTRPAHAARRASALECGMRSRAVRVLWVATLVASALGATVGTTGSAATSEPFRGGLEGDWEPVIQAPRRPWAFVTHLKRAPTGWVGTMTFPGFPDFPLSDVRAETTWVHLRFPPELESLVFDGDHQGEAILGRV